jgi:Fe(3+) dicitrate transport protein
VASGSTPLSSATTSRTRSSRPRSRAAGRDLTNGGETLHEGLEIGARLDSATLTGSRHNVFVRGAYTWLPVARFEGSRYSSVPGQGSVSVSGNRLPYAPEALLTLGVGYRHPRGFVAQLETVHVGEQFADDLNSVAASADGQRGLVPAYTICNLALSYDLRRVTLRGQNLFDELTSDRSRGCSWPAAPRQLGFAALLGPPEPPPPGSAGGIPA